MRVLKLDRTALPQIGVLMVQSIATFMQELADAFLSGDHEWLATVYSYPLAVFLEGEIKIEKTSQEMLDALFSRRASALAAGTLTIRTNVLECGETSVGRFPVRVDWAFLGLEGKTIATSEMRYFCRLTPTCGIKIEILEFISPGFDARVTSTGELSTIH